MAVVGQRDVPLQPVVTLSAYEGADALVGDGYQLWTFSSHDFTSSCGSDAPFVGGLALGRVLTSEQILQLLGRAFGAHVLLILIGRQIRQMPVMRYLF